MEDRFALLIDADNVSANILSQSWMNYLNMET